MKKLLVLMMALILTLSLAACGGDKAPTPTAPALATPVTTPSSSALNTSESIDFVEVTGNGISFALPVDIEYVDTDEATGSMIFANAEKTAAVTLGVKTEDSITSADITDDDLLAALSAGGRLSNATLENSGTVEQDGGTAVAAFGKGTMENGTVMNSAIQYFFPADGGGYHVISYLYAVDAGSSLDLNDNITLVMSTVKSAK